MKSNKNIKILLPLVIIIWGILLYNIYDAFYPDAPSITQTKNKKYKPPIVKKKEAFKLLPLESDPFLGTPYKKPKRQQTKTKVKKVLKELKWPTINYQGIVSDKNAKNDVYIVNLNGRQFLLKKGDTIQSIKVLNGSSTSIRIKYKSQIKEFKIM